MVEISTVGLVVILAVPIIFAICGAKGAYGNGRRRGYREGIDIGREGSINSIVQVIHKHSTETFGTFGPAIETILYEDINKRFGK